MYIIWPKRFHKSTWDYKFSIVEIPLPIQDFWKIAFAFAHPISTTNEPAQAIAREKTQALWIFPIQS